MHTPISIAKPRLLGGRGYGYGVPNRFPDVRVFHPNAQSNQSSNLTAIYRNHEAEKKRVYGQRVREVEHASFTPLVFSSTDGMGREAAVVYKRIASLISLKRNCHYSHTIAVPTFVRSPPFVNHVHTWCQIPPSSRCHKWR